MGYWIRARSGSRNNCYIVVPRTIDDNKPCSKRAGNWFDLWQWGFWGTAKTWRTAASHLSRFLWLKRNTWCVRVFRNSVITKVICISQNVIAVLNTARSVRHVCWSSSCPSEQSQEALWSVIVAVRVRATRNCSECQTLLEIRQVARKLPSNLWKAVPDSENRPSLRVLLYFLLRTIARESIVQISSKGTNTSNPKFLYLIASDVSR